jgi:hypothetical protein
MLLWHAENFELKNIGRASEANTLTFTCSSIFCCPFSPRLAIETRIPLPQKVLIKSEPL